MEPWLVHPIPYGLWFLVVCDNTRHFYYNKETQKSYWQLSEVFELKEVDRNAFLGSLDLDQVGLLMARMRGLKIEEDKKGENKKKGTTGAMENEVEATEPAVRQSNNEQDDETQQIDNEGENDSSDSSSSTSDSETETNHEAVLQSFLEDEGLAKSKLMTGYSSELDDTENEGNGEDKDEADDELALDLSVKDTEGDHIQFFDMLSSFSNKIDIMSPWFLVEEELAGEFAQDPRYFSVDTTERESAFNAWVEQQPKQASKVATQPPSDAQAFFKLLMPHKKLIKKSHYHEFLLKHPEVKQLDLPSKLMENLFRQFKITMVDQEEYERSAKQKPNHNPGINLKRQRLEQYLRESKHKPTGTNIDSITEATDFEKWVTLCHVAKIHEKIYNSPLNFVVGDEKRLDIYKQWISAESNKDALQPNT